MTIQKSILPPARIARTLSARGPSTSMVHSVTAHNARKMGRQLERRPDTVSAAFPGGAVEIAGGIPDQAALQRPTESALGLAALISRQENGGRNGKRRIPPDLASGDRWLRTPGSRSEGLPIVEIRPCAHGAQPALLSSAMCLRPHAGQNQARMGIPNR